jgi:opacity protein-like surface antigen
MKVFGACLLCLTVIGFATPAAAQDTPKAVISGGYNWLTGKSASDESWEKFPKGWYFDVAGNVTDMVSIVGQVTGNYKTFEDDSFKLKLHTFMVGVRGSSPGRVRGFGQVLVGGAKFSAKDTLGLGFSASETDLAFQVGGGVDILGSGPVGARVGLDYLRVNSKDDGEVLEGDSINGFRFSVGVTFGIGK